MASGGSGMESICNILECKICLSTFREPKMLPCHHMFCKECLEGVMKFRQNGSIDIPCPNRCPNPLHLEKEETLEKLGSSYEIKAILETLKPPVSQTESSVLEKRCSCQCGKRVTVYCCGTKMCNICFEDHMRTRLKSHRDKKTSLCTSEENKNLKIVCPKHSSICSHVCCAPIHNNAAEQKGASRSRNMKNPPATPDTIFMCVYCLNRDHRYHAMDTIDLCAQKVKNALKSGLENVKKLNEIRLSTEESLSELQKKFDEVLKNRKREYLLEYIQRLEADEVMLREELKRYTEQHMSRFPTMPTPILETHLQKDNLELALSRKDIMHHVGTDIQVPTMHLALEEGLVTGNRPLGYITRKKNIKTAWKKLSHLAPNELSLQLDACFSTHQDNVMEMVTNNDDTSTKLDLQLQTYVESMCEGNEKGDISMSCPLVCTSDSKCTICSLTKDLTEVTERGISFLEELVDGNEVSRLGALIAARPSALDMRGSKIDVKQYTLLHYAVGRGASECIEMLCRHFPNLMEIGTADGYTPLHAVAIHQRVDTVRMLLECGANPYAQNKYGRTPLDEAKAAGSVDCATELENWL